MENVNLVVSRVEGRGPAVITEVNLSDSFVKISDSTETNQKEKKYRDVLESLRENRAVEENSLALLVKQDSFWDQCADSLSRVSD